MKLVLSLIALAASAPAFAAEAAIELLPEARVAPGPVVLGEVARVHSQDLALIRALVSLPVGRAPAAGEPAVLERAALSAWMQRRLASPAVLAWSGPEGTRVVTASRTVAGEAIADAARDALRQWLAGRSDRSDVQVAWVPRDIEAPEGALRLQPRPLGGAPVRSRMVVWVDVWASDRFVRTVAVPFAVNAWRDAASAAVDLPAGAPLQSAPLVQRPVDIAALDGAPLAAPADAASSQQLRRPVAAGAALRARDVGAALLVQRGQFASLRSGAGLVTSEARVEVLQDGHAGENVRVRQPGAMAQVTARVVGPGQLEIVQ